MRTILVVDDMTLNRVMMMEILKKNIEDVSFLEATNGEEALVQIYEKEIDLVILDLNMPVKDGYEVLDVLKKDERYINLPIIVNSSITDIDKVNEALSLGATDYFVKSQKIEDMEIIISTKVKNFLDYYGHVNNLAQMKNKIENDMNIASVVQRDFLKAQRQFDGIQTYVHYEAFNSISGDLFATAEYKGNKWVLLVDMKNSSVSSALLSLFFRELFMKYAKFCDTASELIEKLNTEYMKLMSNMDYVFFSAIVVLIKDEKVYVASAGSNTSPYIYSKDFIQEVRANGRMIGIMEDTKYSQVEYDFVKGDALIIYTDGLFSKYSESDSENITSTFFHVYDKYYKDDKDSKKLTLNIYNEFLDKTNGIKDDLTIACLKKI